MGFDFTVINLVLAKIGDNFFSQNQIFIFIWLYGTPKLINSDECAKLCFWLINLLLVPLVVSETLLSNLLYILSSEP